MFAKKLSTTPPPNYNYTRNCYKTRGECPSSNDGLIDCLVAPPCTRRNRLRAVFQRVITSRTAGRHQARFDLPKPGHGAYCISKQTADLHYPFLSVRPRLLTQTRGSTVPAKNPRPCTDLQPGSETDSLTGKIPTGLNIPYYWTRASADRTAKLGNMHTAAFSAQ